MPTQENIFSEQTFLVNGVFLRLSETEKFIYTIFLFALCPYKKNALYASLKKEKKSYFLKCYNLYKAKNFRQTKKISYCKKFLPWRLREANNT